MSNFVFVLDTHKRPLNPVHPGKARSLLNTGAAAVFRRYPFTVILKESCPNALVQELELKLDPGSRVTGIAVKQGNKIIFGAELQHRGQQIKEALPSPSSQLTTRETAAPNTLSPSTLSEPNSS